MAAIGVQEVSVEDIPLNVLSGSATYIKRKVRIYVTGQVTAGQTLDVSTYVPSLTGILNIDACSFAGLAGTAKATWSGTTLTWQSDATGKMDMIIVGYY